MLKKLTLAVYVSSVMAYSWKVCMTEGAISAYHRLLKSPLLNTAFCSMRGEDSHTVSYREVRDSLSNRLYNTCSVKSADERICFDEQADSSLICIDGIQCSCVSLDEHLTLPGFRSRGRL